MKMLITLEKYLKCHEIVQILWSRSVWQTESSLMHTKEFWKVIKFSSSSLTWKLPCVLAEQDRIHT